MAESQTNKRSVLWADWTFRVITIMVIPLAGWLISMYSSLSLQQEQLNTQQKRLEEVIDDQRIERERLQTVEISVARIEGKVDNANQKLDDIRAFVSDR